MRRETRSPGTPYLIVPMTTLLSAALVLTGASVVGAFTRNPVGACTVNAQRFVFKYDSKTNAEFLTIVWRNLTSISQTSTVKCALKCMDMGASCSAFAVKHNTDCLLLGNMTDEMDRAWINVDGDWVVHVWQNVKVNFPIFRASSGSGVSVYNTWLFGPSSSLSEVNLYRYLDLSSPLHSVYKHPIVNDWQNWNITEVQMSLYTNTTEVVRLTFNGLDTTAQTWFAKSQLLSSPWTDLPGGGTNYFSVSGIYGRRFYINSLHNGCNGDHGWLTVLDYYDICPWAGRVAYPAFTYVRGTSKQNWISDQVRDADDMVIVVILSF